MWCLAEGRLRYFIELLCLIRFSREPSILRQSPGCLHHAMLSPGIFKTPTGVHASVLCSHEFWLNVNIFAVSVHAGSWSCQWHNKICSEHHQYRNKQRYWQPCILFAHKNRSPSHSTTSIIFKLSVLFIFSWLISKMVFAERGETISGGNFHGEYPAKVRMCFFFWVFVVVFLVSCVTLSFLVGSGLFIYCSPWVGLYQWEEDWKVV